MNKPFQGNYPITCKFNEKYTIEKGAGLSKPITTTHTGVDWALPQNTPLYAPSNCVVIRIEKWRLTGFGKTVYMLSSNGRYEMFCAHMSEITVSKGQKLHKGDLIGKSGNTGWYSGKTGYHLHFEMKRDGVLVDPLLYLKDPQSNSLFSPEQNEQMTTDNKQEYTTKLGDSLWSIAKKYYGEGKHWTKIYNLNLKKIGRNPSRLQVGLRLKIPTL